MNLDCTNLAARWAHQYGVEQPVCVVEKHVLLEMETSKFVELTIVHPSFCNTRIFHQMLCAFFRSVKSLEAKLGGDFFLEQKVGAAIRRGID